MAIIFKPWLFFQFASSAPVIIFTIPISFIGVFLIFYLTKLPLIRWLCIFLCCLCGITVNAAIYLLNEYNRASVTEAQKPGPVKLYLKAWNAKIIPILLTVVSTVSGFIPFMVGTQRQGRDSGFLLLGTIGGLDQEPLALLIYLPIFCAPRHAGARMGKEENRARAAAGGRKRPAAILFAGVTSAKRSATYKCRASDKDCITTLRHPS